ncbi:MAG: hypothetical protein AB1629_04955 [Candidatus Omnitrophota bacterium]
MITQISKRKIREIKGQASIELAAAIIAIFILFLGAMQIFVWFNHMLVERQEYYEGSRSEAGGHEPSPKYEHTPTPLKIFPEGEEE